MIYRQKQMISFAVKVDGIQVAKAEVGNGITKTQFNVTKGKRTCGINFD